MTNEELFADLKQFITATVSQQTAQLEQRLGGVEQRLGGVEQRLTSMATKDDIALLDQKLDLIQDAIGETMTHSTKALDAKVEDHDRRLRRLERRAA